MEIVFKGSNKKDTQEGQQAPEQQWMSLYKQVQYTIYGTWYRGIFL